MKENRKIAFVVPRYVESSAGGAEVACRHFAEKLKEFKNIPTEILTTCAEDHFTWLNVHPEGSFEKNSVIIRRFPADKRKNTGRFDNIALHLSYKQKISDEDEQFFFENNLNSSKLYTYIREHEKEYAFFIFMPYLFGLSINGSRICPGKTLLVPCLHNEPFAKLPSVKNMFQRSQGIICNSPPERDLVIRLGKVPADKTCVAGIGVDVPKAAPSDKILNKYNIRTPYIFYCGRREPGKNFPLLLEMFREYKRQNRNALTLVTAGSGYVEIFSSDKHSIIDTGFVSEEEKMQLYKEALFTCQPSTKESFSISIMESWLQKRPVLVNKRSPVTDYWTALCGGGFSFFNFYEFEEICNYALSHEENLKQMGQNGFTFAENNFSWINIIDRFLKALLHFGYVI